jgi:hypothetical protein
LNVARRCRHPTILTHYLPNDVLRLTLLLIVLAVTGCGPAAEIAENRMRIDLDAADADRVLRFYFGSYTGAEPADPFETGLLEREGARVLLNLGALPEEFAAELRAADTSGDRSLDWDELAPFFEATYYRARRVPATLQEMQAEAPYATGDPAWFVVEKDGVMTVARRRLFVRENALRAALAGYAEAGERLLYPIGTVIVGEHLMGREVAETTVMQKRADGFWDYIVYGPDGRLMQATATEPRPLRVPTQCSGCHFGSRLFEPEASFPAPAPDGPHGPRAVHVGEEYRNTEVVRHFAEHARRSDTVLGIYNTLFVSRLVSDRREGRISPEDAALLDGLGL